MCIFTLEVRGRCHPNGSVFVPQARKKAYMGDRIPGGVVVVVVLVVVVVRQK